MSICISLVIMTWSIVSMNLIGPLNPEWMICFSIRRRLGLSNSQHGGNQQNYNKHYALSDEFLMADDN